jgi:hypothetical protein
MVVGAYWEDSGTAGVQSTAAPTVDEAAADSGAAFVYAGAHDPSAGGSLYLPSLWSFNPRLLATLTEAAIPEQPVTVPGAAFYTATITCRTRCRAVGSSICRAARPV